MNDAYPVCYCSKCGCPIYPGESFSKVEESGNPVCYECTFPDSFKNENARPPIFDKRNRPMWDAVRRLLIYILRELDRWYGWRTFTK